MRKINLKSLFFALPMLLVIGFGSAAQAEWNHGIGTGIGTRSFDGDIGTNIDILNLPFTFDVELEPDDYVDVLESAFGLAGYSTDGNWVIQYSIGGFELEDSSAGAAGGSATVNFEYFSTEVTVGYNLVKSQTMVFGVLGGFRYTDHDWDASGVVFGTQFYKSVDDDWVDALVGVTLNVPFADKWSWNNRLDAGFGGSEGTYNLSTGLGWRFHERWSTGFNIKYTAVEYEDSTEGAPDWDLYDVDELVVAANILFNW